MFVHLTHEHKLTVRLRDVYLPRSGIPAMANTSETVTQLRVQEQPPEYTWSDRSDTYCSRVRGFTKTEPAYECCPSLFTLSV